MCGIFRHAALRGWCLRVEGGARRVRKQFPFIAAGAMLASLVFAAPAAAVDDCTINGTDGSDSVDMVLVGEVFCGGAGNDHVGFNFGTVKGGQGDDSVVLNFGSFEGGNGNDSAGENHGTFAGGKGNDDLSSNFASGTFFGGHGNDSVWSNEGTVEGGPGDDVVSNNFGTFRGGPGTDSVLTDWDGIFEPGPQ